MHTIKGAFLALILTTTGLVLFGTPIHAATPATVAPETSLISKVEYSEPTVAGQLWLSGWVIDTWGARPEPSRFTLYINGDRFDPDVVRIDLGIADLPSERHPDYPEAGTHRGFDARITVRFIGRQKVYVGSSIFGVMVA